MTLTRKKEILGISLLIIYLLGALGVFFGVALAIVVNKTLTLDSHLIFGLIFGSVFWLAAISVVLKLKFKRLLIWYGVFDFIFFPLAIPFYYYVFKTFSLNQTPLALKEKTFKRWSIVQFFAFAFLSAATLFFWIVMTSVTFKRGISHFDASIAWLCFCSILIMTVLALNLIGSLLSMFYILNNQHPPRWVFTPAFFLPIVSTSQHGMMVLDKNIILQY